MRGSGAIMKFRWWHAPLAGAILLAIGWLSYRMQEPATSDVDGRKAKPSEGRPNVVLISIDTTRPDHLGCYGYGKNTSPHIDRLAGAGIRFANARTQTPWTLPSHMSLMTSMLPSHNGMDWYTGALSSEIPMLAQILKKHEYKTAGLVNDAQMMAVWGFNRGFDLWREFPESTPEGNCENITKQALQWLRTSTAHPFFLFLHYYDPHAPYDPPQRFKEKFGSSLSGQEAFRLQKRAKFPSGKLPEPKLWAEVVGSYDGEIAWLDEELGKLFEGLPDNTLVVLFSDHGEAFKEHGRTDHGASLYDEEVRSVLIMRHPRLLAQPKVVEQPVMLMDVAPTILRLCDIEPPPHYEGTDLGPLWQGKTLPDRLILSENKTTYVGSMQKMAMLGDWKFIYSVLDGKQELYKMPDEQTDLSKKEMPMAKVLFGAVREWMEAEDFWMVHAHGQGEFTATFVAQGGRIRISSPLEVEGEAERNVVVDPNERGVKWTSNPKGGTRSMYLQFEPKDCMVLCDFQIDGVRQLDKVHLGQQVAGPKQLPAEFNLSDQTVSPLIEKPFQPPSDGFFVRRHRGKHAASNRVPSDMVNDQAIQQLRSLGYLR